MKELEAEKRERDCKGQDKKEMNKIEKRQKEEDGEGEDASIEATIKANALLELRNTNAETQESRIEAQAQAQAQAQTQANLAKLMELDPVLNHEAWRAQKKAMMKELWK